MKLPAGLSEPSTLVDLLRQRGSKQPERLAYTFLTDGEEEACRLTYRELDQKARAIGAALQSLAEMGERALLLYPPGLEYIAAFFGCLYAGVVAVPAYPLRPNQSLARLQTILGDAEVRVVLTTSANLSGMKKQLPQFPDLESLQWLTTDTVPDTLAIDWRESSLTSEMLAFLQYTSGSTSVPKGVMLTHGNLLHNLELIRQCFGHTSESQGLIWLPPYHDMGLIGGILQPLYAGFHVTLMSPYAFLQRPLRWLQAISRTRATTSGGPSFAYELCVRRVTAEQLEALDLSSWDVAFNGAEPINGGTLKRFADTFEPCGFRYTAFYPCYGLAEGTLIASGGAKAAAPVTRSFDKSALEENNVVPVSMDEEGAQTFVGSGQVVADQKIAIVDPQSLTRCEEGRVGEILIAGPSVAQGYWNQPEASQKTFKAFLADTGEGPFLRTGDLGFIHEGELFVTGRLKDLIIIRGRNYAPHDIEETVEQSHEALRPGCGAAFSTEVDDEEQLVVVQEVERQYLRNLDATEVIAAIRQAIMKRHELRVHDVVLVKTVSLPKTSSGKIQRHLCRASFLNGDLSVVAAWKQKSPDTDAPASMADSQGRVRPAAVSADACRDWLVRHLAERLKVAPAAINVHESFVNYGLDSMAVTTLSARLEEWLGRRLAPNLFWDYPTIDSLAQHLAGEPQDAAPEEILEEYYNFDLFPEYQGLKQIMASVDAIGGNPYFKVNDSITDTTTRIEGQDCINFSAYNYLGMSGDPVVSRATKEAIDIYGTSVSASRVASGERPFHRELEMEIADLVGTEDAVVFIGGHTANVTTIGTICGPSDLILYDAFSHNSVLQGCQLSGAQSLPFPHNDWQALDALLTNQRKAFRRVLIVIEGVYSMDGDLPELPRFIDIKQRHKALLMIDEAHSIGVLGEHGRGLGEHFKINPHDVDLWMGTLSKSFASCGGYIAGSRAVVEFLKYSASGFVYSVGISPPNAVAALTAIRLLKAEPERVARLHERAKLFLELAEERALNYGTSRDSPVVPFIVGDSFQCIHLSRALLQRGINVQPIIYPAVDNKAARLRFFISCNHTEEQIRYTVETLTEEHAKISSHLGEPGYSMQLSEDHS